MSFDDRFSGGAQRTLDLRERVSLKVIEALRRPDANYVRPAGSRAPLTKPPGHLGGFFIWGGARSLLGGSKVQVPRTISRRDVQRRALDASSPSFELKRIVAAGFAAREHNSSNDRNKKLAHWLPSVDANLADRPGLAREGARTQFCGPKMY
jgi:hypothetical protein